MSFLFANGLLFHSVIKPQQYGGLLVVDKVFSWVNDASQCAQYQCISVIVCVDLWVVVLHRKDVGLWNTKRHFQFLHLILQVLALIHVLYVFFDLWTGSVNFGENGHLGNTHVSGCQSDIPHLYHMFITQDVWCLGRDDTNQNMNLVLQSGVFVVVIVILRNFSNRIELKNNINSIKEWLFACKWFLLYLNI